MSLCRGFSLKNESTWNSNAGPVHVEETPKDTATQTLHTDRGSTPSSQSLHSNTDPNTDAPATSQELAGQLEERYTGQSFLDALREVT